MPVRGTWQVFTTPTCMQAESPQHLDFPHPLLFPLFTEEFMKTRCFRAFWFQGCCPTSTCRIGIWISLNPLFISYFFFMMEREISQFMFCLLEKGSRLFKYLKREIHQVTFGKIDLNNSFLQNYINPWSMENVRTHWMPQKPLNTIFPQDTEKIGRGAFLPGFIVSLLPWVFPCPFVHRHLRSEIQTCSLVSPLGWPSLMAATAPSPSPTFSRLVRHWEEFWLVFIVHKP